MVLEEWCRKLESVYWRYPSLKERFEREVFDFVRNRKNESQSTV